MSRSGAIAVGIALLAGCAGAPVATGDGYRIRHIGSSVFIEPAATASARAIAGAMMGTAIAARLQSPPIPLKPGTDYACKYPRVAKTLPGCTTDVHQTVIHRK